MKANDALCKAEGGLNLLHLFPIATQLGFFSFVCYVGLKFVIGMMYSFDYLE